MPDYSRFLNRRRMRGFDEERSLEKFRRAKRLRRQAGGIDVSKIAELFSPADAPMPPDALDRSKMH
jgi:hypothetical protein